MTTLQRHPIRGRVLRDHACECQAKRRKCVERVYMNVGTYRRAAQLGRIVSLAHIDGPVIERTRTYAIVEFVEETT